MLLPLPSVWQSLPASSGANTHANYRSVPCTSGEVPRQRQRNGFAPTSGNGAAKVLAGSLLQLQVKVLCAVDSRTIDKRFQDFPPFAPK